MSLFSSLLSGFHSVFSYFGYSQPVEGVWRNPNSVKRMMLAKGKFGFHYFELQLLHSKSRMHNPYI